MPSSIFISYSRKNEREKNQLLGHLKVLEGAAKILDILIDDEIGPGAEWEVELNAAMQRADIALLLISVDYLNSRFIRERELPTLRRRHESGSLIVIPVLARACAWDQVTWLAHMNIRPRNAQPIWTDAGGRVDSKLAQLSEEIAGIVSNPEPRASVRHNVPLSSGHLVIGREAELRRVLAAIRHDSDKTTVEIIGSEGSGRSALAQQVAHECLINSLAHMREPQAFEGIVWISGRSGSSIRGANASSSAPPYSFLDRFFLDLASVLKRPDLSQAARGDRYACLNRILEEDRYLVVLDDADEVWSPELAEIFSRFPLPSKAVVTARQGLGCGDEVVPLSPLPPDKALEVMNDEAQGAHVDSVARLSDDDLAALIRIFGGQPLGLRLAVALARQSGQTLPQVRDLLEQQSGGPVPTDVLLEELERALTVDQRTILGAFCVYPEPTTAAALEAVSGIGEGRLMQTIGQLRDLGLIRAETRPEQYVVLNQVRERTTRGLALWPWLGESATRRAVTYLVGLADANSTPGHTAGFDRLEWETGNLMWAAHEAYELEDWRAVTSFRRTLSEFLYARGHWDEALRVGHWGFSAARELGQTSEQAWCALYPLSRIHFWRDEYQEAVNWSEISLSLFTLANDDYGAAAACRNLGRSLHAMGYARRARGLFTMGLAKARAFDYTDPQRNMQAFLLGSLAELDVEVHDYDSARQKYDECLSIYSITRNEQGLADVYHRLGNIFRSNGDFGDALKWLNESLRLTEKVGSDQARTDVLWSLASLAECLGDLEAAQERLLRVCGNYERLNVRKKLVAAKGDLARVSAALEAAQKTDSGVPQ